MHISPILLEVFKNRFASIAEEMGVTLMRTGFSPNIKERRDFSCALFDARGQMIAQAAHIPVHLGSMQLSVQSAIAALTLGPGDMAVLNDPFKGGTHLPDITLVAPVFADGAPAFYVANRAHHADVGGMAAGSMPLATSIFQEGLVIPPLKLVEAGAQDRKLMDFFLANLRTPEEREGDFAAQIMANTTGGRRLQELIARHGLADVTRYAAALMDHSEAVTRAAIAAIPDGVYHFEDFLDDDGFGAANIPIRVAISIQDDHMRVDFRESADQVRGPVNAVRSIAASAALYVIRCLIAEDIATNAGCLRPIELLTRPGSVVDARFPASVAGGNVETSQRLVDALLGALAQALENIPAASQGTMNNVTIGGHDPRNNKPFAYYETLAGGMGASDQGPGAAAVHSHMTNTLNTPAEALEYAYPLLVTRYSLRQGTGGAGVHPGGHGLVRELECQAECEVTVLSERRSHGPYGLAGGQPGTPGRNVVIRNGQEEEQPGKFQARLQPGNKLRMETPGGGGWGK